MDHGIDPHRHFEIGWEIEMGVFVDLQMEDVAEAADLVEVALVFPLEMTGGFAVGMYSSSS